MRRMKMKNDEKPNRRITKGIAQEAASLIGSKKYSGAIKETKEELCIIAGKLVVNYIPSPVLQLTKEYSDFMCPQTAITFRSYSPKGYLKTITTHIDVAVPYSCRTLTVDWKDYIKLSDINERITKLNDECRSLKTEIVKALLSLKTEKRVREELPEVLEYIEFPATFAPPALIYTDLRNLIKKIK